MVSIKDPYADIVTGLHAEPPLETMKRILGVKLGGAKPDVTRAAAAQ